jgi:hypothetical protein
LGIEYREGIWFRTDIKRGGLGQKMVADPNYPNYQLSIMNPIMQLFNYFLSKIFSSLEQNLFYINNIITKKCFYSSNGIVF